MKKSLTVVVPIYNEEKNIEELIDSLAKVCKTKFVVLFIDDKSNDSTLQVLHKCLQNKSFLNYKIVLKEVNEGKTSCIRVAIPHITTSHFVILDADMELNPNEIVSMWEVIKSNKGNSVFGYRSFRSHSSFTFRYVLGNRILSFVYGMLFNQVITDLMCGYKLLPTKWLENYEWRLNRFGVELELACLLWKKGIRPFEIEVEYRAKGWEDGKVIGVRDAVYMLVSMVRLRISHRNGRI